MIYDVEPISAIQQSDPVIRIYTFFFSCSLPSCCIARDWIQFPVLCSRGQWVKNATAVAGVTVEEAWVQFLEHTGLKAPVLSQLGLGVNPWPGNVHIRPVQPFKKKVGKITVKEKNVCLYLSIHCIGFHKSF